MIELMVRNHANETWSEANARDHEADPKESCQTCLGVFVRLGIPGGPNACVRNQTSGIACGSRWGLGSAKTKMQSDEREERSLLTEVGLLL